MYSTQLAEMLHNNIMCYCGVRIEDNALSCFANYTYNSTCVSNLLKYTYSPLIFICMFKFIMLCTVQSYPL